MDELRQRIRYAGKVMAIERMTKNLNPGILLFYIFFFCGRDRGGGGEGGRGGQGKGRCWQGSGSNYFHM